MASEFKMQRVTTLKLPDQEEAQKLLEKVAWQVEPIMRKHGWTVPLLAEFLPKNEGLLGLNSNRGAKIQVRLRQTKESGLMPYESALGTTLHELVHCDLGPHSAEFYKMLDELNAEADALEAKGLGGSGAGFDADGQKLSGTSHNPTSLRDARLAAVAAAEKRAQKRSLGMAPGGGGQMLGGRRPAAALPPAQMAALAAQRRGADEKWCSSTRAVVPVLEEVADWLGPAVAAGGGGGGANAPAVALPRPARTGPAAAAALARLQPQVARGGAAKRAAAESAKQPALKRRRQPAPAAAAEPRQQSITANKWSCSQCTLLNDSGCSTCSVCSHPAPPAAATAAGGPALRLGNQHSAATKPPPAKASPEVIELLVSDSD